MIPKEKAKELVDKYFNHIPIKLDDYTRIYYPSAKQFALICVEEILGSMGADRGYSFWNQVKDEIEKL